MTIGRIVNVKRSATLFIDKFIDFHLKHVELWGELYNKYFRSSFKFLISCLP